MGAVGPTESETCRDFVVPEIVRSGWAENTIREQYPVQAEVHGRYLPDAKNRKRKADYVLFLRPDLPMLVIEAKRLWSAPGDGIQQAIRYGQDVHRPATGLETDQLPPLPAEE